MWRLIFLTSTVHVFIHSMDRKLAVTGHAGNVHLGICLRWHDLYMSHTCKTRLSQDEAGIITLAHACTHVPH